MKLLICMTTYNRLAYTKKTLRSLINTIDCPYYLVVCDNNSTDGTQEWLEKNGPQDLLILNPYNFYPGRATNIGWERGLRQFPQADYLMRLDNDMKFEPFWDVKAEQYFDAMPVLGQLGLDNTALDSYNDDPRYITTMNKKSVNAWPGNIGGPCIIRREAYNIGARYDESPWQDLRDNPKSMITPQEDVKFSLKMHSHGYIYGHPAEKLAETFATPDTWDKYPEYYEKTMRERGYKWEK